MRILWAFLGTTLLAGAAGAQTTETPVPFDSARRVLAVTPSLAERFHLGPPAWPVSTGDYRDVRLYSVEPGGGFVLVVQLSSGVLRRFAVTPDERVALGRAIDAGMLAGGRASSEAAPDVVSEPAGNAFARHQTFLAAVAYGPLAASLTDDGAAAGALYLAVTGATFFASYGAAQSTPFTRAQNDLAGTLGLAAGTGGWLMSFSATGSPDDKQARATALASALVGTITGASLGRSLTDAEAHSATLGIETAAAAALSISAAFGTAPRGTAAAVTAAGALGYPIGVRYPRRAGYTVTAGDAEATSTAALIGVLAGATALGGIENPTSNQTAAFLGAGYVVGALVGDLALARRYDFTQSDATVLNIGAVAGALVGLTVPVLAQSDNLALDAGAPAVGAILGMSLIAATIPTTADPSRRVGSRGVNAGRFGARFSLMVPSVVGLAGRLPGRYSIGRIEF